MKHLTTENFDQEIANAKLPIVVDFWAEWCPPCKRLNTMLPMLSDKLNGIAEIVKVDIDNNISLAERYSVKSIPTLMIFNNGQFIGAFNPSGTTDAIAETIKAALERS